MPAPSLATNNPFALLQDDNDEDMDTTDSACMPTFNNDVDDVTDKPTTALAFSVLDHETGKFLEHRQLRRDPKHKCTWDKSYAIYGADAQLQNIEIVTSPPLNVTGIKRVQAIVGCLLYYAEHATTSSSAHLAPSAHNKHWQHKTRSLQSMTSSIM